MVPGISQLRIIVLLDGANWGPQDAWLSGPQL